MTLGFMLPKGVYLFLISSGGFSLLFTYIIIVATHLKFRKAYGCPPQGHCQLPGYPYTSWLAIISCGAVIVSMPLVPGQGGGLIAGMTLVVLYTAAYFIKTHFFKEMRKPSKFLETQFEIASELQPECRRDDKDKN
jgi:AAT family amino acid transporter